MIAHHGGPFTDSTIAVGIWRRHHAIISFARNEQIGIAAEYASSFVRITEPSRCGELVSVALPGTRTIAGSRPRENHPGFDFPIIPDVIDGSEEENDDLLAEWPFFDGVPVYHLHESLDRLLRFANSYSRIARGSSGPCRSTCPSRGGTGTQQS
jgi:hypothetical protein